MKLLKELLNEKLNPDTDMKSIVRDILADFRAQSVRGSGKSHEYRSLAGMKRQATEMLQDAGLPPDEVMMGVEMIMKEVGKDRK